LFKIWKLSKDERLDGRSHDGFFVSMMQKLMNLQGKISLRFMNLSRISGLSKNRKIEGNCEVKGLLIHGEQFDGIAKKVTLRKRKLGLSKK
jgi:hypothetical protein